MGPTVHCSLIHPYHHSLLVGLLIGIQCPYRAVECKFLLVGKQLRVDVSEYMKELRLRVCPDFFNSDWHVLFILLGWLVGLVLRPIKHCRLLNAESIFIHFNSSISNNSVYGKFTVYCQKHFYFQ